MLAILVALTGCVLKTDDTTEPLPDGTIVVLWEVGASGCETAGVEDVLILVGDEQATLPCDDGQATFDVPAGTYDIHLDGLDAGGTARYAGDAETTVGAGQTVNAPTVLLSALPADLTVTWRFENGALCASNGVGDVDVTVFEDDFVVDSVTVSCNDGAATIEGLVAGGYDVNVLARDDGGVGQFTGTETVELEKGELGVLEITLVAN